MSDTAPVVSIVLSTYNRCTRLPRALTALTRQREPTPEFELIVVDNNSTDSTRQVVEDFMRTDHRVRYLFEPKQGLANGWNAGFMAARADIVATTDDDLEVASDWVQAIVRSMAAHPEAWFVAGRVLPVWPKPAPSWLTRKHWTPLSLTDHGDREFIVDRKSPRCLPNAIFRRRVFDEVGLVAPAFGRVGELIGSTEDHELQLRIWRADGYGVYSPAIVSHSPVAPERMSKAYHRRWHTGHGVFSAMMRLRESTAADGSLQPPHAARLLVGVPLFLYRAMLAELWRYVVGIVRGNASDRFARELDCRATWSYIRTRARAARIHDPA